MSQFDKQMQQCVNMEYDELVGLAKYSIGQLQPVCQEIDKDNNGALLLTSIILSAIATDGKLSKKKYCSSEMF